MQTPCIFLIGPPKHGKSEARRLLAEITHLKGGDTSDVIYRFLALRKNVSAESLKQLPKEQFRAELIEAGDYLVGTIDTLRETAVDPEIEKILYRIPSALIRTLYLNGHNIIAGVRRRKELTEARQVLEWNGVRHLTVWIERPDTDTVLDNTEVHEKDADEIVLNDGTLEQLQEKLFAVLEKHFGKQDELQKPVTIVDQQDINVPGAEAA